MDTQAFFLVPFHASNLPEIQIGGSVARENGQLRLQYRITGAIETIALSPRSISPARKDGLWAATCFEFFLALPDHPRYWEFNLASSCDWNIYCMDSYRRVGFREEALIERLPFEVKQEPDTVIVDVNVDLSPLIPKGQPVQMGIACVIQNTDLHGSYWALVHPHPMPDFHSRESFIIQL